MVGRMACSEATAMVTSLRESPRPALISSGMAMTATMTAAATIFLLSFMRGSGKSGAQSSAISAMTP